MLRLAVVACTAALPCRGFVVAPPTMQRLLASMRPCSGLLTCPAPAHRRLLAPALPSGAAGAAGATMQAGGGARGARGGRVAEDGRGGGRGGVRGAQGGRVAEDGRGGRSSARGARGGRVAEDGRGGRGGRGGSRAPPPSQKTDRAGLSRREWELAVQIGGSKKSPSALAQLFALAKKGEYGKLEDLWDREGTSKNEVKRRVKAIKQMHSEDRAGEASSRAGEASPAPSARELALKSELRCIHFGECAGCTAEAGLAKTPLMAEARDFFEQLLPRGEGFRIHIGSVHRWRTLAKLAVAPAGAGQVGIGLYQSGTHDVMAIPSCRVHHPSINEAVEVLQREMLDLGVSGYNEFTGVGHLRYVQMMVERHSNRVQMTLVWNADNYRTASPTVQLLVKRLKLYPMFHSLWINFRTGTGNVIFNRDDKAWHLAHGPPYVRETILAQGSNLSFPIGPNMFRQGNLEQFEAMLRAIQPFIPPRSRVCELYAGAGVIGLSTAASTCEWLRCSDENPANLEAFLQVKRGLPADTGKRVSYTAASAEEAITMGQVTDAQVLIVDPPRKGLDLVARWLAKEVRVWVCHYNMFLKRVPAARYVVWHGCSLF
jgi:tRNA/tmRNA/rRNA uracil-C5-methylase (TrmA/RlmC/RlmD family)